MSDTTPASSAAQSNPSETQDIPTAPSPLVGENPLNTEAISEPSDSTVSNKPEPSSATPDPSPPPTAKTTSPSTTTILKRVQTSLRQTIKRYAAGASSNASPIQAEIQQQLEQVAKDLQKLESGVLRVAVFGLVSRGKSSVINALIAQDVLQTGPLHGVTKWPRSVYWSPPHSPSNLQVEFIDTPGLDEVDGTIRADMANEVAEEADLILFVLAGDITPIEYQALVTLLTQRKPLMIVCNKMDLYPEQNADSILQELESVLTQIKDQEQQSLSSLSRIWQLMSDDIVQAAAAPSPIQVRVEWPNGEVTHEWENPPAQIEALSQRLSHVVNQDGPILIALNALRDSQLTEAAIASTAMDAHDEQAEELLWQFAKWKGLAVAANPLAFLDVAGGVMADLVMIRSLARLYGLPMTGHDAGALWNAIVWSSGGLLAAEIGSKVLMGIGKTAALTTSAVGGIAAYSSTAIAQATLAGYGSYRVGKAAQLYLKQGCSWGPHGANTVIKTILEQSDNSSILNRLKKDLESTLPLSTK